MWLYKQKNAETRMNTGFQHKQRRYETWTFQKKCSGFIPSFNLARPEGFEPPTFWFVAKHSIQLSYERLFIYSVR